MLCYNPLASFQTCATGLKDNGSGWEHSSPPFFLVCRSHLGRGTDNTFFYTHPFHVNVKSLLRGVRVVEGADLERLCGATHRGFESLPLSHTF